LNEPNNLSFKESRIPASILTIAITAFLSSTIPSWSWLFFGLNCTVLIIAFLIVMVAWKRCELEKRYFSILSYCLLFSVAFMGAQPILRVSWESGGMGWMYLGGLWILTFAVTTFMKENIFQAFSKTFENRFSIAFHLIVLVLILLTPVAVITANSMDYDGGGSQMFIFGSITYVFSVVLLVVLPAFLKHPKDIIKEQAKKGSLNGGL
jgi:hypothetical protein